MSDARTTSSGTKPRFNIIDFIIIVVIIAMIAAVVVRYDLAGDVTTNVDNIHVTISYQISNVRKTTIDAISEGDTVVWKATGMTIGTIRSAAASDALKFIERSDGTVSKVYDPERNDITGTIDAAGIITEEGFMLGGTRYLGAGMDIPVTTDKTAVTITILAVEPQ